MGKLSVNQKGFSIIEALLLLVAIALIGGAGWYVYTNNKSDDTATNTSVADFVADTSKTDSKADPVTLPDDWQWFESQDKTVSFAYPKAWGTLAEQGPLYERGIMAPVVITKKTELMTQIPKGFEDNTWYLWDMQTDALVNAVDKQPIAESASYTKPVALEASQIIESITPANAQLAIYKVRGKGAMNCGSWHYFFAVNDSVVHLSAALCSRDGEWQPQEGETYTDVVENELPNLYKYIQK